MLNLLNLSDPTVARLLVEVEPGDYLFRQGDRALTMIVILSGEVELHQRTGHDERLVDTIGPGEILGEKAIVSDTPFRRILSARARGRVTMVELDGKTFRAVQTKVPAFSQHILRTVIRRLERANEMVGVLQLRDPAERVIHHLLSLCRHSAQRRADGIEIRITIDRLHAVLNLHPEYLRDCLDALTANDVLIPRKDGYVVRDENALLAFISHLKERVAA